MKRTGRKNSTIICLLGMSMLLSLGVCVLMVPIEGKASSRDVRVSVVERDVYKRQYQGLLVITDEENTVAANNLKLCEKKAEDWKNMYESGRRIHGDGNGKLRKVV